MKQVSQGNKQVNPHINIQGHNYDEYENITQIFKCCC